MIKGLKKTTLEKRGDHKGPVFNLDIHDRNLHELPIIYRAKGSMGAAHFHKGWDKANDPQVVLLIKGEMKLNLEDLEGNKEEIILEEGDLLEIPKLVLHDYEMLEETIFGELRSEKYDVNKVDKYFIEDFKKLQK